MKTDEENAAAGLKGDKVSDSKREQRTHANNKLRGRDKYRLKRRRARGRAKAKARRAAER